MKKFIFFAISVIVFSNSYSQKNNKDLLQTSDTSYQVDYADEKVEISGKKATDIILNNSKSFAARNQDITVLSATIKESGIYLITYKLTGQDSNTFHPRLYPFISIDSSGDFFIKRNNEIIDSPKKFLENKISTESQTGDSSISFSSTDLQYSKLAYLDSNDIVSLHAKLSACLFSSLRDNVENENQDGQNERQQILRERMNMHPKWFGNWKIEKAEIILIKVE